MDLFEHKSDTTKVIVKQDDHDNYFITLGMDGPEGKGEIVLAESAYGWELFHEGFKYHLGIIDMYYASEAPKEYKKNNPDIPNEPPIQFIVHVQDSEDPVAYVRYFEDHEEITFESGARLITFENGVRLHGKAIDPSQKITFEDSDGSGI